MKKLIIILLFFSSSTLADNFPDRLFGIGIYSGWYKAPVTEFKSYDNGKMLRFVFNLKENDAIPYDLDSLGFIQSKYFNHYITILTNEIFQIKTIMGETSFVYSIEEANYFETECFSKRNEVRNILKSKHNKIEFEDNYISQSSNNSGIEISDIMIASDDKKEIRLGLVCQFFSLNSTSQKDKLVSRLAIQLDRESGTYIPFGKKINKIDFNILTKDSGGL